MDNTIFKQNKTIERLVAVEEAAKCLLCHDAPCSKACPAETDPASFIRSFRFGNIEGAAETIRRNNPLGGVCARVCPYDKYCESVCIRSKIDAPIKIGLIQRYVTDRVPPKKAQLGEKPECGGLRAAVVGSGPAGLAAAASLARDGFAVTVFESKEKPGGFLTYGIPKERLPQEVVDREIENIANLGVEFRTSVKIGRDLTLEDLRNSGFGAVLLAVGLHRSRKLDLEGADFPNVVDGTDYLEKAYEKKAPKAEKVVVIGGGDVAADCAITAKRLGAKDVKILYRRAIEQMPAGGAEKKSLLELGIPVFSGFKPAKITGIDGAATCVFGAGLNDGSSIELPADLIIAAIGQEAEYSADLADLRLTGDGFLDVDDCRTGVDGVFACGDVTPGDKTVVYAVRSGKKAAEQVSKYLKSPAACVKAEVKE